jgi:hypothetical protein
VRGAFEKLPIEGYGADIKTVQRSRGGSRSNGVNQDQTIRSFPSVHQVCEISFVLLRRDASLAKPARGNEADGVVVPELVTQSDDDHDSRCTSSFRKWVEHEMQGS